MGDRMLHHSADRATGWYTGILTVYAHSAVFSGQEVSKGFYELQERRVSFRNSCGPARLIKVAFSFALFATRLSRYNRAL